MEKTCIDCNAYLPVPPDEFTEFGICLDDRAFGPFVEELLEGTIPDNCQALVEEKKFPGERPVCAGFHESEIIEIDDDSLFGQDIRRLSDSGELTPATLEEAVLREQVRRIDWKTMPVDRHVKQLDSERPGERDSGISSLGAMICHENRAAFQALLRYLSSLPAAETLEAVHLKRQILRHLDFWKDKSAVAPILIDELGRIQSSNRTRQWISEIFRFLDRCPLEGIQEALEAMLSSRRSSHKFRRRVSDVLSRV